MLAAGIGVLGLGAAKADINPKSIFPTITGSGPYTYTYNTFVTNSETVNPGSFFTFVDVNGLVAGSETMPTDFTATETLTGPVASGFSGTATPTTDSGSIPNVTYTYTGATPIVGLQNLGAFSFQSVYGTGTTPGAFTAVAGLSGTSLKNANLTTYLGPTVGPTGGPTPVPELGSVVPFAFGALGLLSLGLRARKTRRTGGAAA